MLKRGTQMLKRRRSPLVALATTPATEAYLQIVDTMDSSHTGMLTPP